uniref:DNA-directed RNA polymerase subunit beta'' n=1 Tax=Koshicola spirodelophila TaxID=1707787 RepID=A0A160E7R3_9CHLO|nr:RNA polymerase beta subunit [Koshicola spirodelophila]
MKINNKLKKSEASAPLLFYRNNNFLGRKKSLFNSKFLIHIGNINSVSSQIEKKSCRVCNALSFSTETFKKSFKNHRSSKKKYSSLIYKFLTFKKLTNFSQTKKTQNVGQEVFGLGNRAPALRPSEMGWGVHVYNISRRGSGPLVFLWSRGSTLESLNLKTKSTEFPNFNTTSFENIFWNHCFDKSRLKTFIFWCFQNYGQRITVNLLEKLKLLGFGYATKAGISLSIDDLMIPPTKSECLADAEIDQRMGLNKYKKAYITGLERFHFIIETWHRTSEFLKNQMIHHFKKTDLFNPVYMMAFSGSRGNVSQVRQLVGMRGLMADPQGQIIDFPIRSNFREGLTLTEYVISCYGARKGVVDTALRTANAGYLTRRLVDVAQHVIVSCFDCGTQKGIFLSEMKSSNLPTKKALFPLDQRLIGRVLARDVYNHSLREYSRREGGYNKIPESLTIKKRENSNLTPNSEEVGQGPGFYNYLSERPTTTQKRNSRNSSLQETGIYEGPVHPTSEIIGYRNQEISFELGIKLTKTNSKIFIRSPLTCQTKRFVCQLCYGWSLAEGHLVSVGEAVGIIAAQSIGEPGTQLTMRTFHSGGVFSGEIMDQLVAPFDGFVYYSFYIPGTLMRTPQGKIAFLTKFDGELVIKNSRVPDVIVKNDLNESNTSTKQKVKRYRLPPYSVLFLRNGDEVSKDQLMAELYNKKNYSIADEISDKNKSNQKMSDSNNENAYFYIASEIEGQIYSGYIDLIEKSNYFVSEDFFKGSENQSPEENIFLNNESALKKSEAITPLHFKNLPASSTEGDLKKSGVPAQNVIFKSVDWGFLWVLSGKICTPPLFSTLFPQKMDLIDTNSVMSQVAFVIPHSFINSHFSVGPRNHNVGALPHNHSLREHNGTVNKSGAPTPHYESLAPHYGALVPHYGAPTLLQFFQNSLVKNHLPEKNSQTKYLLPLDSQLLKLKNFLNNKNLIKYSNLNITSSTLKKKIKIWDSHPTSCPIYKRRPFIGKTLVSNNSINSLFFKRLSGRGPTIKKVNKLYKKNNSSIILKKSIIFLNIKKFSYTKLGYMLTIYKDLFFNFSKSFTPDLFYVPLKVSDIMPWLRDESLPGKSSFLTSHQKKSDAFTRKADVLIAPYRSSSVLNKHFIKQILYNQNIIIETFQNPFSEKFLLKNAGSGRETVPIVRSELFTNKEGPLKKSGDPTPFRLTSNIQTIRTFNSSTKDIYSEEVVGGKGLQTLEQNRYEMPDPNLIFLNGPVGSFKKHRAPFHLGVLLQWFPQQLKTLIGGILYWEGINRDYNQKEFTYFVFNYKVFHTLITLLSRTKNELENMFISLPNIKNDLLGDYSIKTIKQHEIGQKSEDGAPLLFKKRLGETPNSFLGGIQRRQKEESKKDPLLKRVWEDDMLLKLLSLDTSQSHSLREHLKNHYSKTQASYLYSFFILILTYFELKERSILNKKMIPASLIPYSELSGSNGKLISSTDNILKKHKIYSFPKKIKLSQNLVIFKTLEFLNFSLDTNKTKMPFFYIKNSIELFQNPFLTNLKNLQKNKMIFKYSRMKWDRGSTLHQKCWAVEDPTLLKLKKEDLLKKTSLISGSSPPRPLVFLKFSKGFSRHSIQTILKNINIPRQSKVFQKMFHFFNKSYTKFNKLYVQQKLQLDKHNYRGKKINLLTRRKFEKIFSSGFFKSTDGVEISDDLSSDFRGPNSFLDEESTENKLKSSMLGFQERYLLKIQNNPLKFSKKNLDTLFRNYLYSPHEMYLIQAYRLNGKKQLKDFLNVPIGKAVQKGPDSCLQPYNVGPLPDIRGPLPYTLLKNKDLFKGFFKYSRREGIKINGSKTPLFLTSNNQGNYEPYFSQFEGFIQIFDFPISGKKLELLSKIPYQFPFDCSLFFKRLWGRNISGVWDRGPTIKNFHNKNKSGDLTTLLNVPFSSRREHFIQKKNTFLGEWGCILNTSCPISTRRPGFLKDCGVEISQGCGVPAPLPVEGGQLKKSGAPAPLPVEGGPYPQPLQFKNRASLVPSTILEDRSPCPTSFKNSKFFFSTKARKKVETEISKNLGFFKYSRREGKTLKFGTETSSFASKYQISIKPGWFVIVKSKRFNTLEPNITSGIPDFNSSQIQKMIYSKKWFKKNPIQCINYHKKFLPPGQNIVNDIFFDHHFCFMDFLGEKLFPTSFPTGTFKKSFLTNKQNLNSKKTIRLELKKSGNVNKSCVFELDDFDTILYQEIKSVLNIKQLIHCEAPTPHSGTPVPLLKNLKITRNLKKQKQYPSNEVVGGRGPQTLSLEVGQGPRSSSISDSSFGCAQDSAQPNDFLNVPVGNENGFKMAQAKLDFSHTLSNLSDLGAINKNGDPIPLPIPTTNITTGVPILTSDDLIALSNPSEVGVNNSRTLGLFPAPHPSEIVLAPRSSCEPIHITGLLIRKVLEYPQKKFQDYKKRLYQLDQNRSLLSRGLANSEKLYLLKQNYSRELLQKFRSNTLNRQKIVPKLISTFPNIDINLIDINPTSFNFSYLFKNNFYKQIKNNYPFNRIYKTYIFNKFQELERMSSLQRKKSSLERYSQKIGKGKKAQFLKKIGFPTPLLKVVGQGPYNPLESVVPVKVKKSFPTRTFKKSLIFPQKQKKFKFYTKTLLKYITSPLKIFSWKQLSLVDFIIGFQMLKPQFNFSFVNLKTKSSKNALNIFGEKTHQMMSPALKRFKNQEKGGQGTRSSIRNTTSTTNTTESFSIRPTSYQTQKLEHYFSQNNRLDSCAKRNFFWPFLNLFHAIDLNYSFQKQFKLTSFLPLSEKSKMNPMKQIAADLQANLVKNKNLNFSKKGTSEALSFKYSHRKGNGTSTLLQMSNSYKIFQNSALQNFLSYLIWKSTLKQKKIVDAPLLKVDGAPAPQSFKKQSFKTLKCKPPTSFPTFSTETFKKSFFWSFFGKQICFEWFLMTKVSFSLKNTNYLLKFKQSWGTNNIIENKPFALLRYLTPYAGEVVSYNTKNTYFKQNTYLILTKQNLCSFSLDIILNPRKRFDPTNLSFFLPLSGKSKVGEESKNDPLLKKNNASFSAKNPLQQFSNFLRNKRGPFSSLSCNAVNNSKALTPLFTAFLKGGTPAPRFYLGKFVIQGEKFLLQELPKLSMKRSFGSFYEHALWMALLQKIDHIEKIKNYKIDTLNNRRTEPLSHFIQENIIVGPLPHTPERFLPHTPERCLPHNLLKNNLLKNNLLKNVGRVPDSSAAFFSTKEPKPLSQRNIFRSVWERVKKIPPKDKLLYTTTFLKFLTYKKSGQVIHFNKSKITIRQAQSVFFSPRCVFYAFNGDFVEKNKPIVSLPYQKLRTGDIVQGIPKVEQMFEARTSLGGTIEYDSLPNLLNNIFLLLSKVKTFKSKKTNLKNRLKKSGDPASLPTEIFKNDFLNSLEVVGGRGPKTLSLEVGPGLRSLKGCRARAPHYGAPTPQSFKKQPLDFLNVPVGNVNKSETPTPHPMSLKSYNNSFAVRKTLQLIQIILVNSVQRIYRSQGVTISDKHLEVIVRQMTNKVKITHSGESGFLRGEDILLQTIEKYNKKLKKNKVKYKPILLGITKASLEVESFLSAASFQHTARVLSTAAFEQKIDFLYGLKENIIIGNLIPAGTGYFVITQKQ